jgi:hypothetical protein
LTQNGQYGEEMPARAAAHSYVQRLPVPALADLVSAVFVQQIAPGGASFRRLTATSARAYLLEAAERCAHGHDHAASDNALLIQRG